MPEVYYTPTRISVILHNWPRYQAAAERVPSSVPTSHRPTRGKPTDSLWAADIIADIERALVLLLARSSLQWTCVILVQGGYSFAQIARAHRLDTAQIVATYDAACLALAACLGWIDDGPT